MLWLLALSLTSLGHAQADCRVERVSPGRFEATVSGELLGSGVLVKREDAQLLGGRWYRESLCQLSLAESWWAAADALQAAGRHDEALLAADQGLAVLGLAEDRLPRGHQRAMPRHHHLRPSAVLPEVVSSRQATLRDSLDRYAEAIAVTDDHMIQVVHLLPVEPATPPPPPLPPAETPAVAEGTLRLW